MTITVGFSRPKSGFVPFAWAIMWYQGSDFSHSYIRFKSNSLDRELIYQASSTMVNFWGATYFESKETIAAEYEIEVTDDQYRQLMQYFIDNAGKPYGVLQLVAMFVNRTFGIKLDALTNGDREFVCSELVARILSDLDIPEGTENLDYMLPVDVKHICDTSPRFKRIR